MLPDAAVPGSQDGARYAGGAPAREWPGIAGPAYPHRMESTRAVVLGGGGPVGIGWEAGLLVGLAESGVDVAGADSVVGTSAGSVVGFTLASELDLTEATSLIAAAQTGAPDLADPAAAGAAEANSGLEALMATVAEAASNPDRAEALRARLGRTAIETQTLSESDWLAMFDFLAGAEWPAGFSCTAVDTADGRYRRWHAGDGVEVQRAVASSCAVPGIFPPVSIDGSRWMDGGVRDMLNADAAAGHAVVLAVSCTLLEIPPELSTPELDAMFGVTRSHLDGLRAGGAKVETIVPGAEMLEISGWGLNLMDFDSAGPAYEAGVRQGRAEAPRLTALWNG